MTETSCVFVERFESLASEIPSTLPVTAHMLRTYALLDLHIALKYSRRAGLRQHEDKKLQ